MKTYKIELVSGLVIIKKAMSLIEAIMIAREDGWDDIKTVEEK